MVKRVLLCIMVACLAGCAATPEPEIALQKVIIVAKKDGDFTTIGEALLAVDSGMTIKIRGGVYYENVEITTPGIFIEAYDPANEPVFIDGGDEGLASGTAIWENIGGSLYSTPFVLPFEPVTDAQYSRTGSGETAEMPLLFLYEDGVSLRGYRNPFVSRPETGVFFKMYGGNYGIAGRYRDIKELDPSFEPGRLPAESLKQDILIPGRFLYDQENRTLVVSPADRGKPDTHIYNLPVKKHLFVIRAKDVSVKNLVFAHAASFAILVQDAPAADISGCVFSQTHFAVKVKNSANTRITGNIVSQRGFWERHGAPDIAGTLFDQPVIHVDPMSLSRDTDISGNLIQGTPFVIGTWFTGCNVANNIIAYSPLGVLGVERLSATAFDPGRAIKIHDNIFHHIDLGIEIPPDYVPKGPVYFFRNALYLPDTRGWPERGEPGENMRDKVFVYHNTIVFAGSRNHAVFPVSLGEKVFFMNNLYYAGRIQFMHFVGAGDAQYPLVFGPYLDFNLFMTPPQQDNSLLEFYFKNQRYMYLKTDTSSRQAATITSESSSIVFSRTVAFEDPEFYRSGFDRCPQIVPASVFQKGTTAAIKEYDLAFRGFFMPGEKSLIRDRGEPLPEKLPDSDPISDKKPDIGAFEISG